MWKPEITLYVIFFATTTIALDSKIRSIEEYNNIIEKTKNDLVILSDVTVKRFEKNVNAIESNGSLSWDSPPRRPGSGVQHIEFDESGDGFRLRYTPVFNDSSCREYLKEFTDQQVKRCTTFLLYSMRDDKADAKKVEEDVIGYLDRIKVSCGNNHDDEQRVQCDERVSADKIDKVRRIRFYAEHLIERNLNRLRTKMDNFVKDLSRCLITQVEGSPSLFDEWSDACLYHTKA